MIVHFTAVIHLASESKENRQELEEKLNLMEFSYPKHWQSKYIHLFQILSPKTITCFKPDIGI